MKIQIQMLNPKLSEAVFQELDCTGNTYFHI